MARIGRFGFVGIAIVFHFIYIYSIFDIYFVSPIVHGMSSYGVRRAHGEPSPAKRLVLFVGDGLRADKAFQQFPDPSPETRNLAGADVPRHLAPFLRSKVLDVGTFGVSHTRMPTESRPGHVALIAGLYEDVSSVTTGWKLNPVNFDSVFNRSRHTWSWGSPDILPMFKEGAIPGRVDAESYGEEYEDFTKDATLLDTWVFNKVKKFFEQAKTNKTLNAELRKDKNVFFLHLLGLDTAGHSYRPYSNEYLHNIKVVDDGVKDITNLFENFFHDDKTAFVFTADHGMSDWGSHGDGHPDNTRTPLIVWGSGVAKPVKTRDHTAKGHEDAFSSDWDLDHIQRNDVAQADVAALMAYLAGLDFPVNSVGELPLAYLAGDSREKAEAIFANTKAILEMYQVKEKIKSANEIRYRGFAPLTDERNSIQEQLAKIRATIDGGDHDLAIEACRNLIQTGLAGLRYLQTYDWLFLRAIVTSGFLGWMAFATTTILDMHVLQGKTKVVRDPRIVGAFLAIGVALGSLLFARRAPIAHYAYAIFPVLFWQEVLARKQVLVEGFRALFKAVRSPKAYLSLGVGLVIYISVLEALVVSYSHRGIYTVCFLLAQFWPLVYGRDFVMAKKTLLLTWAFACQTMSVFTLLDAMKVENRLMILAGGMLMALVGILYLIFEKQILSLDKKSTETHLALDSFSRNIVGAQIGLIILSIVVTDSSVVSLQAKKGLPLGNQVIGWCILISSLVVPFIRSSRAEIHYLHRLMTVFLTFSPIFIILTISYEGLFYVGFCATLITWVRLEHQVYEWTLRNAASEDIVESKASLPPPKATRKSKASTVVDKTASQTASTQDAGPFRPLRLSGARISLFFLFLLQAAFFSTGNIASISSFSLESVYRLIPVFNPFSQGALLMFKLLIPFAVISANLGILNRRLSVAPSSLFMVVMAISDVLTMNFFFLVRDEGSWLDIGTSISHFVIASLLCVFVASLESISEVFVNGVRFGNEQGHPPLLGVSPDNPEQVSTKGSRVSTKVNGSNGSKKKHR